LDHRQIALTLDFNKSRIRNRSTAKAQGKIRNEKRFPLFIILF